MRAIENCVQVNVRSMVEETDSEIVGLNLALHYNEIFYAKIHSMLLLEIQEARRVFNDFPQTVMII